MQQQNHRRDGSVGSAKLWMGLGAVTIGLMLAAFLPAKWWLFSFFVIGLTAGLAARHIDARRARAHFSHSIASRRYVHEELLGEQNEAKFTVLLRPIQLASKVWIEVPRNLNDGFSQLPLEDVVRRAFEVRDRQVICINDGTEDLGAGQRLTDLEKWKQAIRPLLHRSMQIFVLPGATPGCLWEAQHLKSKGLIDKCVFIMPRSTLMPYERYAHYWSGVQAGYRSVGIKLIDYSSSGGLFTLDAKDFAPLFFIKPSLDIDPPLFSIASSLIGIERSTTGGPERHDVQIRVAEEFRELRNIRLSNADQENWSRYLLYQDKLFCCDNDMQRRVA